MKLRLVLLVATLLLAGNARAAPREIRIAVIVGADSGDAGDDRLRFAESDARAMRDLLVDLGDVAPERALVLLGGSAGDVLRLVNEARGRAAELGRNGDRVVFFFYYSGHGDDESLHLPHGRLALRDLLPELASVPAALRVTIIDACRFAGRIKGVTRGPAFRVGVAPEGPRGDVALWASSLGEAAAESDELGGAVFTHYIRSALRGAADRDGDGAVTLSELYAYVYRRTLYSTSAAAVTQHPALAADVAGAGELVLTRPKAASATIELPPGGDRYLVFAWPNAAVVAELGADDARKVAVPAGRYLVSERIGGKSRVADVELPWGGNARLSEHDFRAVAHEELVARGGHLELHAASVSPVIGVELAPIGAATWALRVGATAAWSRGALALAVEGAYAGGDAATTGYAGAQRAIVGAALVGVRGFVGRATAALYVGAELRWTWQSLTRLDADRVAAAGLPVEDDRSGGGIGPRAVASVAVPLGHRLSASLALGATALVARQTSATGTSLGVQPLVSATVGVGYAF